MAGKANDPKLHAVIREVIAKLSARLSRDAFNADDHSAKIAFSNAVEAQQWRLIDIPDETLALILVIMADEKTYTDTLAIYNALVGTSKDLARVMEQYEIWRAMTEAYIFRSKWNTASIVTTKEARKLTREHRDMYMQTLFDHYEMVVTKRSTRPELNERWRTWKRILEHFKRIDKRIQDNNMVEEKEYFSRKLFKDHSMWANESGPIISTIPIEYENDKFTAPINMISCPESPYTISVFNNKFHFISGFGNPTQWIEASPEFTTGSKMNAPKIVAVAYPKKGVRSAYTLMLELDYVYDANSDLADCIIRIHTAELKDKNSATPTSKLWFKFNVSKPLVSPKTETRELILNFAASRDYLMAFTAKFDGGIESTGFVYKYNHETLSYVLMHRMDGPTEGVPHRRCLFEAHTFRSNIFILRTISTICVFEILDDGVKTRVVEIPDFLQLYTTFEMRQVNGTGQINGIVYLPQVSHWRATLDPNRRDRVPDTSNIGLCDVDKVLIMPEDEPYKIRFLPFYTLPDGDSPAPMEPLFSSQWLLMVNNVRIVGMDDLTTFGYPMNAEKKLTLRYFDLEKLDWDTPVKWSWAQKPRVERVVNALVNSSVRLLHFHNGTLIVQNNEGIACYSYCAEEWHAQEETQYMLSSANPNMLLSSQQLTRSHPTLQGPLRANFEKW